MDPIRLVGLLLIALYSAAFLIFLNALYEQDLMVRRSYMPKRFVYFSQDIFDLFWLIIMWLPMTLYAGIFLSEGLIYFSWEWILFPWLLVFVVGCIVVVGSTKGYNGNNEGKVWSARLEMLDPKAYRLYNFMELYNCGLLLLIAILTVYSIYYHIAKDTSPSSAIYICSLIATILFFTYFVMNTLSKLTADIKIDPLNRMSLLPIHEIAIGVVIILLLVVVAVMYLDRAQQDKSLIQSLQYIIGSLVLPLVPIAIQLVQLASPLREQ